MRVIDKDGLQNLIDDGKSPTEISEMLHVGLPYIYKLMKKYGIEANRATKHTESQLSHIQELYDQGLTLSQVASEMHITYHALQWVNHRYHLTIRAKEKAIPKLMQIRSQYFTEKLSVSEIADRWGVTEEEMQKYMTDNHLIGTVTRKVVTHATADTIPDNIFDDWFHKCPVCGKQFAVRDRPAYAYKMRICDVMTYFCSWTCIQKYRAKHQKRAKRTLV